MPINKEALELLKTMSPEEQDQAFIELNESEQQEVIDYLSGNPNEKREFDEFAEKLVPSDESGTIVEKTYEAMPFYNQARTASAVARDMAFGAMGGKSLIPGEDFSDKYSNLHKKLKEQKAKRDKKHPILSKVVGAASIVPTIAMTAGSSTAASGVNAVSRGLIKSMGTAGLYGGAYSASVTDQDVTTGKGMVNAALETGLSALISAGTAGAIKGGGQFLSNRLKQKAARKAFNALGGSPTQIRVAKGKINTSDAIFTKVDDMGSVLNEKDIIRINPTKMYGRLVDEGTNSGQKIGTLWNYMDDDMAKAVAKGTIKEKGISRIAYAKKLEDVAKTFSKEESNLTRKAILDKAARIRKLAETEGEYMSFSKALQNKYVAGTEAFKYNATSNAAHPIKQEVAEKSYSAMADLMEDLGKKVNPETMKLILAENRIFSNLTKAGDIFAKTVEKHAGFQTLQNLTIGSAVAMQAHPGIALGLTVGREAYRKYGSAIAAKTLKAGSKLSPNLPNFGDPIQKAAVTTGVTKSIFDRMNPKEE